ncbi:MAG: carboxypeptidase-like regulatory domain-containing protein [Myxococcota bacterium]
MSGRAAARASQWLPIALVALVGCESCHRPPGEAAEPGAESEPAVQGAEGIGVVEGVVRLAEGAELPEYSRAALEEKPDTERPEGCPPPKRSEVRPVRLGDGRGLEGVLVSATDFSESPPHEPKQREVVIRDCILQPALVVGMRGEQLVVRNESDYPFLPRIAGDPFMQALPKGKSREIPLERGGAYPLVCGMGAPCGRADVIVLYHPVYAVTESGGRFRIPNVPADGPVKLHAWHPLFEEAELEVDVEPREARQVALTLKPAERVPTDPEKRDPKAKPDEADTDAEGDDDEADTDAGT